MKESNYSTTKKQSNEVLKIIKTIKKERYKGFFREALYITLKILHKKIC